MKSLTYLGGKEKEKDRCSYVLKTLEKSLSGRAAHFYLFLFFQFYCWSAVKTKLFFVMYVLHRGLLKCFTLIFSALLFKIQPAAACDRLLTSPGCNLDIKVLQN